MNTDYYGFEYDKFVKYICSNLNDVKKSDVYLEETTYGDVSIAYFYDDSEGIASWLANKSDYAEYIFNARGISGIELSMPIVRATQIAENFEPKVLKKTDDGVYIGDKKSTIKFWVDVQMEKDSDGETYPVWDWNATSFSLDDYNDLVLDYFQQSDDAWYAVDDVVADLF